MTVDMIIRALKIEQIKYGVFTDEADLLKVVTEHLPRLDECCIIRQEAIHRIGIPDIVCCYKGRFVAIELKDDEGVQSELQKKWQKGIEAAKGIYILADSVNPICDTLMQIAQGKI